MKHLTTSILTLITLASIAFTPIAALADDSVQSSGDVQVSAGTDNPGSTNKGPKIPGLDQLHIRLNANAEGSSTAGRPERPEGRMASSTVARPIRPEGRSASSTLGAKQANHLDNVANQEANAKDRASKEIEARIGSLNQFSARISGMVRVGGEEKTALSSSIAAQIAQMTALKAKIDSETGTTTLKADVESITKSYRVYAVVLPKAAITAASDRVLAIAAQFDAYVVKLQARITAAQTAGTDVTAATAALTDMQAKIADAKTQATDAASSVAGLVADNGDQTVKDANTAALKAAKVKVDAAQADLKAARADVTTILKAVAGAKGADGSVKVEASAGSN